LSFNSTGWLSGRAYADWTWSRRLPHTYEDDFSPRSLIDPDGCVSWWVQARHQYFVALLRNDKGDYEHYKIGGTSRDWDGSWSFQPSGADKTSLFSWWARPEGDHLGFMRFPGPGVRGSKQELSVKTVVLAQPPGGGHGQALILCLATEAHIYNGSSFDVTLVRCSRVPAAVKQALLDRIGYPIHLP
jgi:hypothetical protein